MKIFNTLTRRKEEFVPLETIDNFDYRSSRVVDDTVENAANPCMGCMGCAKR